jgi:hypothetical protein
MGDAADDGGVFSDRRDRESSLPEDREEDIEPAFCPTLDRIWRHNSGSSIGGSNDLSLKEFMEVEVGTRSWFEGGFRRISGRSYPRSLLS